LGGKFFPMSIAGAGIRGDLREILGAVWSLESGVKVKINGFGEGDVNSTLHSPNSTLTQMEQYQVKFGKFH